MAEKPEKKQKRKATGSKFSAFTSENDEDLLLQVEKKRQEETTKFVTKKIIKEQSEVIEQKTKEIVTQHFQDLLKNSDVANLTRQQIDACTMLAKGKAMSEICYKLSVEEDLVSAWITDPTFMFVLSQMVKAEGMANKTMRLIESKKMEEKFRNAMIDKIDQGALKEENLTSLMDKWERSANRVDKYMGDSEQKSEKVDINIVVNNIIKKNTGRDGADLDSFIAEFPVIDVEADEIE